MGNPGIREVYIWRWMANTPPGQSITHPVGAGTGWNPVRYQANDFGITMEMIPVFVDANTGQVVRAGCTVLTTPDGKDLGTFIVDDQGRYLVLTGKKLVPVPKGVPAEPSIANQVVGISEVSPAELLKYFNQTLSFKDGQRLVAGLPPAPYRMMMCGKTFEKTANQGNTSLTVFMKQILLGKTYQEVLSAPEAQETSNTFTQEGKPVPPPPPKKKPPVPPQKPIPKETPKGPPTTKDINDRYVRVVKLNPNDPDYSIGFLDAMTGDRVIASAGLEQYLEDNLTGAYIIDMKGIFYRVDPGSGQVKPVIPPQGGDKGGWGALEVIMGALALFGFYALFSDRKKS